MDNIGVGQDVDSILKRNQLNIENADSIFLFGNDIQSRVNDYIKKISNIVSDGCGNTEYIMLEIEKRIEKFEKTLEDSHRILSLFAIEKNSIRKTYLSVLSNIDQLEVDLKLQEAKLLKDIEMLKRMKPLMETAGTELTSCLAYGHAKLEEFKGMYEEIDKQVWINRLDKRIYDLEISHTIISQSIKQTELLIDNNFYLVDRIISTINITIPVWRTQVALLLGIERHNEETLLQNKIAKATELYVKRNNATLKRKLRKINEIDVKSIKKLNETFLMQMKNLSGTEDKNTQIIEETKKILLQA